MTAIMKIASKHELPVIEDAAQAIGAERQGRRAGSTGATGCFSFYPSKNLGAFGDGGMVTTSDAEMAGRLRSVRVHGTESLYHHKIIGGNFRLDEIQAAVLRVKLRHLEDWTNARQNNAQLYTKKFSAAGLTPNLLVTPTIQPGRHIFNQYILRTQQRDALLVHLKEKGIGHAVYYPKPLHLQECFASLGYREGQLPNAEAAAKETLALPVYPELTEAQIEIVVGTIAAFFQGQ